LAALVSICSWLPALAGPVIGVAADRVRRRPLLIGTHLVLAAVTTALLLLDSAAQVWLLFAVLTLVGAGTVLNDAAETALISASIPDALRGDFNGLVRTAIESMKLVAPLVGASLFAAFGGPAVAALDAFTFALAAIAFQSLRVRETSPAARPRGGWLADTAEGVRYLRRHPVLRTLVVTGAVAMTASGLSSTATYAMLDAGLRQAPALAGVLLAVQGLGSIVSGLAAGALMRRIPEHRYASAGLAVFAAGVLARATPWLPVVLAGSLAIGLGLVCPLLAALTALQRTTPSELLGRVAATANTAMFASTGPAVLVGAAMVATLDYRVQTLTAGGLSLITAAWLTPSRPAVTD
jgi:MFS family permease